MTQDRYDEQAIKITSALGRYQVFSLFPGQPMKRLTGAVASALRSLAAEKDAEIERMTKYADEMALKYCEIRDSKDAEIERLRGVIGSARHANDLSAEVARHNDSLRAQVASLTAERDEWKESFSQAKALERAAIAKWQRYKAERNSLAEDLASSGADDAAVFHLLRARLADAVQALEAIAKDDDRGDMDVTEWERITLARVALKKMRSET